MKLRSLLPLAVMIFGGCGYQLLTAQKISCEVVYLAPVGEEGEEVGLALPLRERLANELVARGAVLSAIPRGAACTMQAKVSSLRATMAGSGYGEDTVNSYTQRATAECWLTDRDGVRQFSSGVMDISEIYLASPDLGNSQVEILSTESSRRRNLEVLAQKLAVECLDRAEERWLQR